MSIGTKIIMSVLKYRRHELGTPEGREAVANRIMECVNLSAVSDMVLFERAKQEAMGFDAKQDDMHTLGQLTMGAVCFAQTAFTQINTAKPLPSGFRHKDWPWQPSSFHAHEDPVGNLVKAAAMLIAEAERIERTRGEEAPTTTKEKSMLFDPLMRPAMKLALERDKPGLFLAEIGSFMAFVMSCVKPERLEEALQDIAKFDEGQSPAMVACQNATVTWVRAELALLQDAAYQELGAGEEGAKV